MGPAGLPSPRPGVEGLDLKPVSQALRGREPLVREEGRWVWTGTELRETQVCRFISNIISRVSRAGRAASGWEKGSGAARQPGSPGQVLRGLRPGGRRCCPLPDANSWGGGGIAPLISGPLSQLPGPWEGKAHRLEEAEGSFLPWAPSPPHWVACLP